MIRPKTNKEHVAEVKTNHLANLKLAEAYIDKCIKHIPYLNSVTIYKSDIPVLLSEVDYDQLIQKYKRGGWIKAYNFSNHIHLGVNE